MAYDDDYRDDVPPEDEGTEELAQPEAESGGEPPEETGDEPLPTGEPSAEGPMLVEGVEEVSSGPVPTSKGSGGG
ncbi:MAG: hypothetical protein J7M26_07555, partial [Armatimonadetes bacterium]|nr:hypothetical protein [Armatimonadota bacterium]